MDNEQRRLALHSNTDEQQEVLSGFGAVTPLGVGEPEQSGRIRFLDVMTDKETTTTSKFLSLILRHEPERVGLKLDEAGWVRVEELLQAVNRHGVSLSFDQLKHIVATSDKQRFSFTDEASASAPIKAILSLWKMGRHDVHLSSQTKRAVQVGGRHGKPVVLTVRAGDMHRAGHIFRCCANGVWLVNDVPPEFIQFPSVS